MTRLPSSEEQAWLLDSLGELVLAMGETRFSSAPIRVATEADFPDAWHGDLASLERLCHRILKYCGMKGYQVRLEAFEGDRSIDHIAPSGEAQFRHHGAAAWFAGIDDKTIRFGCATRQLKEGGEALVGLMAHEVAHAYRTAHGLQVLDPRVEEMLTDLTTVYLGFGVFTVNNTYRYRTFTEELGARLSSGSSTSSAGYLSPQAMSFLFAAQILFRGLSCWQTHKLLRWLEPRQRSFVKAALRTLRPADDLRHRLLPEPPFLQIRGHSSPG